MKLTSGPNVPTQFTDINNHRLAYRSSGIGMPLILCNRLRGVLDSWDPEFLDALAEHFRVIIFDYRGIGNSTGVASYGVEDLTQDVIDLADSLGVDIFVAGGWSIGGLAVEGLVAQYPDRISHALLLGALPIIKSTSSLRHNIYEQAEIFDDDFNREAALFFGPVTEQTLLAARESHDRMAQRSEDRSPIMTDNAYKTLLASATGRTQSRPDLELEQLLASTTVPILVMSGDHDILSPVQNWLECSGVWNSLHLMVLPRAGHAPHHRFPQLAASIIASFVSFSDSP
jgi:pimeloyl-ACP methyl ester carboxylesterase